jgi:hypothetical protein
MRANEDSRRPLNWRRAEVRRALLLAKGLALGTITGLAILLTLLICAYYYDLGATRALYQMIFDLPPLSAPGAVENRNE